MFSVAPLLDYPHCRLVIAPKAKWKINHKVPAFLSPFINIIGFKHITRFIATLFFVSQWVIQNRKYKKVIVLHGVQSCKIWGVLLGQVLSPSIIISFLTDDLGVQPTWENVFLKKLRLFDVHLMKLGLQKISGVIAMTPKLAKKLAPGLPTLIIPTIQNLERIPLPIRNKDADDDIFALVYTGGLTQDYGISLLLDAFKRANRDDWRLMISGWGNLEATVKDFAANNSHVQFLGFLDSKELSELYCRADVFVNPKLSNTPFAEMSFPSKIVEYLGTGKPVISTNLPVLDENFKKHLILTRADTPEELVRCMNEVYSWNYYELESWRNESLRFVNEELSPIAQGNKIRNFITEINSL